MRFAISIPQGCPDGTFDPPAFAAYLLRAEQLGFESAWAMDMTFGRPPRLNALETMTFAAAAPTRVTFNRFELNRILNLYGRMVADGEWRDYAIDFLRDRAVFSVFRRASEVPIYRIEKDPRLARKQGMYSVISATGLILRRGHELDRVLLVIDRKLAVV